MSAQFAECVKSLAIGQRKIEKNDVDSTIANLLDSGRKPIGAQQTGRNPSGFGE